MFVSASFGGTERALAPVDNPSVLLRVPVDHIEREHRQHKLPFGRFEELQKLLHILLGEDTIVVAAVGVHIGQIDEMERIRYVVGDNHIEGIAVLDGYPFQSAAKLLRKLVFRIAELLGHRPGKVVAETPVHHRCERHLAERPHGPRPLGRCEELRIGINMGRMGVYVPAVQRLVDLSLQIIIVDLCAPVKICQLHVNVVDEFGLGRALGEQDGRAAAECLGVDAMLRYERQDVFEHSLFTSVGNWCPHCFSFNSYPCT